MTDANREIAKLEYASQSAEAMERVRIQVAFAEHALKALMLANGGAIVGLFTFIGNAGAARLAFDVGSLWTAFTAFAAGLVFTLLAYLGAFLSQGQYYVSSQALAMHYLEIAHGGTGGSRDYMGPFGKGRVAEIGGTVTAVGAIIAFITGAAFALAGVLPA